MDSTVVRTEKESFSHVLQGENIKAAGKGRSNHRARNKRGSRTRASKDTSKLLLLYDEDILDRDPLREQKDLAFAQAYLTRVGNTAAGTASLVHVAATALEDDDLSMRCMTKEVASQ